jgi:hypothetical protein
VLNKLVFLVLLLSPLAQASTLTTHIWAGEATYPNHRVQTGYAEITLPCNTIMFKLYNATAKELRLTYDKGTIIMGRRWINKRGVYHFELSVAGDKGNTKFTYVGKCMPTTI